MLARLGLEPCIEVLQEVEDAEALSKAERRWIAYFRDMGCPLTNLTDGGEGVWGRVNSPETRERMSRSARMKRYGKSDPIDSVAVIRDYRSGLSMRKVASIHQTSSSVVCRLLQKMSIPIRSKSQARKGAA